VMCERDVGLFSLVQQVVANVPWALAEGRTCYWTPNGYRGATTVWEYYFEAVVPSHPVEVIPKRVRAALAERHPSPREVGYRVDHDTFASSHYGDHPQLRGRALPIPYRWADPGPGLRRRAKAVIDQFVRPRDYIQQRANDFVATYLAGHAAIGVHVRGTDAASASEQRAFRQGSLVLGRYVEALEGLIAAHRQARIFVATDDQSSLDHLTDHFGERVVACDALRHQGGEPAGQGPTGWIMPAYVAGDRDRAARNGEDALVEYLVLSRCDHLVHNGSSLARTVLLNVPAVPHTNTHTQGAAR
jgi:hypothetical protein